MVVALPGLSAAGAGAGDRYALEAAEDDVGSRDALHARGRADDHPVAERSVSELLYVVGYDEVAAVEEGTRLGRAVESERAARRGAEVDGLVLARRVDNGDDVLFDQRVDIDLFDRHLDAEDLGRIR